VHVAADVELVGAVGGLDEEALGRLPAGDRLELGGFLVGDLQLARVGRERLVGLLDLLGVGLQLVQLTLEPVDTLLCGFVRRRTGGAGRAGAGQGGQDDEIPDGRGASWSSCAHLR
jgi:hypothetical protein